MFEQCLPLDDPDNVWKYCPSVPGALILFILFACSTIFHLYQAFRYHKAFCWVLIMGALWETLSFASRILSAHKPTDKGVYDASFLLLIIAPLLINAFDYMLLGRMVTHYLPQNKLAGIKGQKMGVIFVCFDIISFIVQLGGGLLSLSKTPKTANNGLHIYTGGVVFQQALIVCFLCLTVDFQIKLRRNVNSLEAVRGATVLLRLLRTSLFLITYRIIFRIVEFSSSQGSSLNLYINNHEVFVYIFDAVPMFFALILMNIWHPGSILVGEPVKNNPYPAEGQALEPYNNYGYANL